MRILLTGASGFVGRAVLQQLHQQCTVRAVYRSAASVQEPLAAGVEPCFQLDLSASTNWSAALADIDVVIHCAARVHVMHENVANPWAEFRKTNVEGTVALAEQAAAAGVGRFVFISSIKVNGEGTSGRPYTADDPPAPEDAYGRSKAEAEAALWQIAQRTGMEVTIIRPVLVYGPGAKGNFQTLVRWISQGVPLPLGAARSNRRSLVGVDNLVDLIRVCIAHPRAANQVFLVSDGEDVSTAGLLLAIGHALGRPARLITVPQVLLSGLLLLLGRQEIARRLFGSLQVDLQKNRELLAWTPPFTLEQGLQTLKGSAA